MPPRTTAPASKPTQPAPSRRWNGPKAAKPEQPAEVRLPKLFASLVDQINGEHYANALRTTNKILRLEPTNDAVLQTKLFLLLQLDRYLEALALAQEKSDEQVFERTYCLYRLKREDEAREVLEKQGGDDRRWMLLEAQLKYREGDYTAAQELYETLLAETPEGADDHSDLLTNLRATQSHIAFHTSGYLSLLHSPDSTLPPLEALESALAPFPPNYVPPPTSAISTSTSLPAARPRARRSRRAKLNIPANAPPPDPERWLPKKERSGYRPSRGKGRKDRGGREKEKLLTQGSAAPAPAVQAGGQKGGAKKKGRK